MREIYKKEMIFELVSYLNTFYINYLFLKKQPLLPITLSVLMSIRPVSWS